MTSITSLALNQIKNIYILLPFFRGYLSDPRVVGLVAFAPPKSGAPLFGMDVLLLRYLRVGKLPLIMFMELAQVVPMEACLNPKTVAIVFVDLKMFCRTLF